MLLITPQQIKNKVGAFHLNLDESYLDRMIEPTQITDLQTTLGSGFYTEFMASEWLVSGEIASGVNTTVSGFCNKVITYLCWSVGAKSVTFIETQASNAGLFSGNPQYAQKANANQKNNVVDKIESIAQAYRSDLEIYLDNNKTTFTTWATSKACKQRSNGVFKNFGIITDKTGL